MSKKIVAYFSASGITAKTAKELAGYAGADIYEIRPDVPYTKADLNWHNPRARNTIEMNTPGFRQAMADKSANIAEYDTIFLGFPIWWFIAPTIINTFLESYDFTGKKIILFATSGACGFGRTLQNLKPSAPGAEFIVTRVNPSSGDLKRIAEM